MNGKSSRERRLRNEIKQLKECLLLAERAEGHHELREAQREQIPDHLRPYSEQGDTKALERHIERLEADLEQLQEQDWNTAVIDSEGGSDE